MNARHASLNVLQRVLQQGQNLDTALDAVLPQVSPPQDQSLAQHLSYGVLRWYQQLDFLLQQLLSKPLKKKDADVRLILLLGLYQLRHTRIPDHAAVSESVALSATLRKDWARGLINAVLRNYARQLASLETALAEQPGACYSHPDWLLSLIQQAWPDQWQAIVEANNQPPPMNLRINARRTTRADYVRRLEDKGIRCVTTGSRTGLRLLEPVPVTALPGFADGLVAVQDTAAQFAAELLDPQPGERILDACAAPGGKTSHLLEQQADLAELVALDIDAARLRRIEENLQRLGLQAHLQQGDASCPDRWWDGRPFDRILLDAPCSATGVIRRHPDIKLLRRPDDIPRLVDLQQQILTALWPLLKPGGMLLYATCSILPAENTQQIERFLHNHANVRHVPLAVQWGRTMPAGRQILPGEEEMDGFYYATLIKTG